MWSTKSLQQTGPTQSSVSATGAANGNSTVALRTTRKKIRGNSTMSRRRISCKDLGQADFQGWLYKRTSKGLISSKWKKYWFVLKGTCLYWYTNQLAEKAEGFLSLPKFKIDQGTECKKKHAIKASHPQSKKFYFAAENAVEMNKWINKMGLAAIEYVLPASDPKTGECWSESEQEDVDIPPEDSSLSNTSQLEEKQTCVGSSQQEICESAQSDQKRITTGSHESLTAETPQFTPSGENTITAEHLTALTTSVIEQPQNSDEMEQLYKSLEQASLSPIGKRRLSSRKDYRRSFIKRSNNPIVNERLHKFRTLNSTLKAKEADLAVINQLLESSHLTSEKFRQWKEDYSLLMQDICKTYQAKAYPDNKNIALEDQPTSYIETDI
ncbi:interactor protein for cytohesin exchange factors 1 isoform X2 [Hemiscyllium ocellatum]|uniref:interactor protein for cytohesin exchange factors 1 isoform X2 n=1 Tax=Hemiscyllium ocellatum TaxID=170820 RepID=UPI002966F54A|nr:interactor protein for cytohesin exchange factors 1 isoform X2 [Hemiscyllium ocellatum]